MRADVSPNKLNQRQKTPLQIFFENISYMKRYEDGRTILRCLKLLIDCTDINLTDDKGENLVRNILEVERHIMKPVKKKYYLRIIEHIAKMVKLNLLVDQNLINTITARDEYNTYFEKCIEELETIKSLKLNKCWVTFFNLLVDDKSKLVRYVGNKDLITDFYNNNKKFIIYGAAMKMKLKKGFYGRKSFDGAVNTLSNYLPIFNPTHLIIKDILETLGKHDWKILSDKKRRHDL